MTAPPAGDRGAAARLDPVIHAPARLRIMVALAQLGPAATLSFPRLQQMLGLTAGNLITHLRRLSDAGYVSAVKTGKHTAAALTDRGRVAFADYRTALRAVLGEPS